MATKAEIRALFQELGVPLYGDRFRKRDLQRILGDLDKKTAVDLSELKVGSRVQYDLIPDKEQGTVINWDPKLLNSKFSALTIKFDGDQKNTTYCDPDRIVKIL